MNASPGWWENATEALLALSVAAVILERALYQVFDSKLWRALEARIDGWTEAEVLDLKPWIAAAVAIAVAHQAGLDVFSDLFADREPAPLTTVVTGLFLAGGSTGVYKFWKRLREIREAKKQAEIARAGAAHGAVG